MRTLRLEKNSAGSQGWMPPLRICVCRRKAADLWDEADVDGPFLRSLSERDRQLWRGR